MTPRPYRLGRRQAAVDQTRARILKAARALLVARGNTDFSIEAVARRARVTRATVYQRFGSRPNLLEALFDDLARRSEEHTSDSSHGYISYAVFCLKKKKKKQTREQL